MGTLKEQKSYNKKMVESPASQEVNGTGTTTGIIVNRSFVCVRSKPDASSRIQEYVANGDKVEILDQKDGFYKIKYGLMASTK